MGLPKDQSPSARQILTWGTLAPLAIPVGVLLATLIKGFSLSFCGFAAVATLLVVYLFLDFSPRDMKERLVRIVAGFEN